MKLQKPTAFCEVVEFSSLITSLAAQKFPTLHSEIQKQSHFAKRKQIKSDTNSWMSVLITTGDGLLLATKL
jgi:hypothetical protein